MKKPIFSLFGIVLTPILVCASGINASAPPKNMDAWLTQGKEAYEERRYPEAMRMFLKVLEVSPNDFEAKKYILDISRAVSEWEDAGRLKPGELEAAQIQAREILRKKKAEMARINSALMAVQEGLKARGQNSLLSSSFVLTRMSEEDIQDTHFAAQAKIYLEQLQDRLRASLRQGEIKDPKDLHVTKGFLYYQRGLFEPALQEWQAALSIDPLDQTLKDQVGWLGEKIKRAQDKANIDLLSREAQRSYRIGDYDKAVQNWIQVLALNPKNDAAIAGLAQSQRKLKEELLKNRLLEARKAAQSTRPGKALEKWVSVLEVDPTNAEALAAIRMWTKDRPKQTNVVERPVPQAVHAARRIEKNPQGAEEQYAIGMAYYSQGDLSSALDAMKKALELDPSLGKAQIAVERIQAETGQE